jgi:nucleotide-binding universal stress UspA family protein
MRVLIASDLSEASDEAVRQGVALAAGGRVALCHVLPELGTHALLAQEYEEDLKKQLELQPRVTAALEGQLTRLAPNLDPAPEIFIELGSDYEQILRRADEWQAELIVVGTHGHKGLRRLLLGSVADQVVRAANCPVLVARPSVAHGAVLAATDLTDPALPAIETAAAEAARRGCKLVVMHAMESPREGDAAMGLLGALPALDTPETRAARRALASQIITSALTRLNAHGEIIVAEEDTVDEALRLAKSLPAELVVVGTHRRSGLARVVLGSISAQVIENAPCSVLVARQAVRAAAPA